MNDFGDRTLRVAAAAVGGTASELSGGKFTNGAVTGAFSRAFNDELELNKKRTSDRARLRRLLNSVRERYFNDLSTGFIVDFELAGPNLGDRMQIAENVNGNPDPSKILVNT